MIAVIEEIDGDTVRLLDYESQEVLVLPTYYLPNNKKVGVGSYIKVSCIQTQEPTLRQDKEVSGGFIKNKPKMGLA